MEKKLPYWLVRSPWLAAAVVFIALSSLSVGAWYVSVWLLSGVALLALFAVQAERTRRATALALAAPRRVTSGDSKPWR